LFVILTDLKYQGLMLYGIVLQTVQNIIRFCFNIAFLFDKIYQFLNYLISN